jgi:hypothetical protein
MEYDYEDLSRQLNLRRAETERVLAEARQALEAIERSQQLINQHQQLRLRLQEIKVRQSLVGSRISELKSNLRLARIELEGLAAKSKTEAKRDNLNSTRRLPEPSYHGAADGGSQFPAGFENEAEFEEVSSDSNSRQIEHITRLAPHGQIEIEWKTQRQRELSKQMTVYQLQLVELVNQKAKLENHRESFEAELGRTEQQLQLVGIEVNRL